MRKLRLMRRGKTTVSNASIRMRKITLIPAIDAHQCIHDEISDDAGMVADSALHPSPVSERHKFTAPRGLRRNGCAPKLHILSPLHRLPIRTTKPQLLL